MNVAITAIGSVSPVMIVLRQLCRNRNTISTVSSAPSMIVCFTRLTLFSTSSAVELMTRSSTSGGSRVFSAAIASLTPRPVSTMLRVLRLLEVERDRRAAVDARDRVLLLLAVDHVGDLRQIDRRAALLRDDDAANCVGSLILPSTRTIASVWPARDAARGHVLVRALDRGDHLVDADAERGQRAAA